VSDVNPDRVLRALKKDPELLQGTLQMLLDDEGTLVAGSWSKVSEDLETWMRVPHKRIEDPKYQALFNVTTNCVASVEQIGDDPTTGESVFDVYAVTGPDKAVSEQVHGEAEDARAWADSKLKEAGWVLL